MVTTDIYGRGIDFPRVNIVINYDLPEMEVKKETYLHRVCSPKILTLRLLVLLDLELRVFLSLTLLLLQKLT